jgi:hypothetical protein
MVRHSVLGQLDRVAVTDVEIAPENKGQILVSVQASHQPQDLM